MVHELVERRQQQREKHDRLMEVVEKDIVYGKPGKGVQQAADHRVALRARVPFEVDVPREGSAGKFEDQQRAHQVGDHLAGKRDSQPEERTAQQIERVGADKVRAEIGCPAPAPVSGTDGVVAHLIERHLLDVVIAVEQEVAVVKDDEWKKDDQGEKKAQPERLPCTMFIPVIFE